MSSTQVGKRIKSRYIPKTPLEVAIWAILFLLIGILFTQDFNFVIHLLYSEYSVILIIVMILEFLVIKSFDRSQVYKSELDQLQKVHADELHIARKVEELLEGSIKKLEENEQDPQEKVQMAKDKMENALTILRSR